MPILDTDIKLMASERMYDADDGGGRMSGNEIVDGESNNMFPDVSQLDRTYGRLNLRKTFEAVLSNNTETFFGSNIIISKPPSDDTIHCTMFKTSSQDIAWVDERDDAQNKIESYITAGQISPMRLIGTQYEGQRALLAYQTLTAAQPAVGDVYALVDDTNETQQFVRVTDVELTETIYTDGNGDFTRYEVQLTISDPLAYQFEGHAPSRYSSGQPETELRKTNAIPSVSYFGIQPLALPAAFDAREVRVTDYKGHLLPATQTEEAITDADLGNAASFENVSAGGGRTVEVSQVQETSCLDITAGNRGYTYVAQLLPKPEPGTLVVHFRSQEKWYSIADTNGDGALIGDGSGSVNYTTGSISMTLADMPDVDTKIIMGWGTGDLLERHDQDAVIEDPEYRYTVNNYPIEPSTITITWDSGGAKSLTDNGSGLLTGDGTGTVSYATGEIIFTPTDLMDPAEIPQIQYTRKTNVTETFTDVTPDAGTGLATLTLADQPEPHSIEVLYSTQRYSICGKNSPHHYYHWCTFYEGCNRSNHELAANSLLQLRAVDNGVDKLSIGDNSAVDYAAKEVTIDAGISFKYVYKYYTHRTGPNGWTYSSKVYEYNTATTKPVTMDVTVKYTISGAATQVYTEDIPSEDLKIDITDTTEKMVYPGSVAFTMAGHTYWDYEGIMYRDGSFVVADATESGTIDYHTGIVTLTDWVSGNPNIDVTSLLVENHPWEVTNFITHTAVAPIRPGSLTIAVTATNGDLLTGTADQAGEITGDHMRGTVDVDTGIIELEFGELVLDSSLTPEEKAMAWYDPEEVDGDGYIWRESTVWPETGRYNCVAYVYLPLSADILGIDPVRLPMDGRVPLYRVGDVIVIHHTQDTEVTSPYNGQVVDLGRVRLAWAIVYNNDGTLVETEKYSVNLDAGTVTLDDVSGTIAPLTITDRIEDMALVNDLQINGTLGITKALSHDYVADETYVSSALITQDLFARVTNIFEQEALPGEGEIWSDNLWGDAPLASFNNTAYPITITNIGGTQERWMAKFTSSTSFEVYGEFSGLVATGNTSTVCSPLNPATNEPYFTIPFEGWGAGWQIGNVLRFNTIAANRPIWIARTVLQSEVYSGTDQFCIEIRGDIDTAETTSTTTTTTTTTTSTTTSTSTTSTTTSTSTTTTTTTSTSTTTTTTTT